MGGRVNEIGVDDLRFSVDESALFLRDTMGLELDSESVRALGDRTEGWIAGLQMAALSRQQPIRVNRAEDMEQRATPFSAGACCRAVLSSWPARQSEPGTSVMAPSRPFSERERTKSSSPRVTTNAAPRRSVPDFFGALRGKVS